MKQILLRHTPKHQSGRLLLPAALLAASCVAAAGFLTSSAAAAQDASSKFDAVQDATKGSDAKKQDKKDKPQIGRGRLTGKKQPPKPAAVPKGAPTLIPKGVPDTAAPEKQVAPPQKPVMTPDMTAEERMKLEQDYLEKLKASQAGSKNPKFGAAAPRPPRNPNAKLDIEYGTETHDFGRARQGDQLTHVFKMKSGGSEPLIISQASPTCGCTLGEIKVKNPGDATAELYRFGDPIEPNADIELSATLDTGSKRNNTQVRIQIYSNDGKAPANSLVLKASIQPFIVASPPFLQLGQIRQGTERTAKITFRTNGGEKVLLTVDDTRKVPMPEGLSFEVEPVNPDEEGKSSQWAASFKVGPTAPEGAGGYMLRMNTDIKLPTPATPPVKGKAVPIYYSCDANISYNIIGALSMQPAYISLGLVRPGQPQVRSTRLTAHEEDFDLSGVKVEVVGEGGQELLWADRFAATVKPVAGSNAVDVELRLEGLPDEADGAFRGRVKITTGHESKPELFLRFSGVCRKLAGNVARPAAPQKKAPAKDPIGVGGGK